MAVAKDQIRQIITENNITSVADVYSLLKDSLPDLDTLTLLSDVAKE